MCSSSVSTNTEHKKRTNYFPTLDYAPVPENRSFRFWLDVSMPEYGVWCVCVCSSSVSTNTEHKKRTNYFPTLDVKDLPNFLTTPGWFRTRRKVFTDCVKHIQLLIVAIALLRRGHKLCHSFSSPSHHQP